MIEQLLALIKSLQSAEFEEAAIINQVQAFIATWQSGEVMSPSAATVMAARAIAAKQSKSSSAYRAPTISTYALMPFERGTPTDAAIKGYRSAQQKEGRNINYTTAMNEIIEQRAQHYRQR